MGANSRRERHTELDAHLQSDTYTHTDSHTYANTNCQTDMQGIHTYKQRYNKKSCPNTQPDRKEDRIIQHYTLSEAYRAKAQPVVMI